MTDILEVAFDVSSLFRQYRRHTGIPRFVKDLFLALSHSKGVNVRPYVNCTELGNRLDRRRLHTAVSKGSVAAFWGNDAAQGLDLNRVDVIHSTFYPPPQWLLDNVGPWVSTIHDLRPIDDPESVETRHIRLFSRLGTLVSNRSTLVHCISNFTANRVKMVWGIPESRTRVIHPSTTAPLGVVRRGLPELNDARYLLFLGSVQPAKGLDIAIGTTAAIRRRPAFHNTRIVVAGSELRSEPRTPLWSRWSKAGVAIRMTHVSETKKLALIQGACAVLCTSRYEGFGFVPLEAIMLSAPPVISTAHPCLEAFTNWPYVFASGDPIGCTNATLDILENPLTAREHVNRTAKHLSNYSWASVASAFNELYRDAQVALISDNTM